MAIEDIKFRDINILLDLIRTGSVRELSRRLSIQPGQISKIVRSMEHRLGIQLIERSAKGIQPTAQAQEILPHLEALQAIESKLASVVGSGQNNEVLGFASTSFFSTHLIPKLFEQFLKQEKNKRCRLVDLPPNQFFTVGIRNGFQVCIHTGNLDWPKTWSSDIVGHMSWNLVASKKHPLKQNSTVEEVKRHPFVYPVYWTSEGLRYGDDQCPLSVDKRIRGHEVATAASGAEIVARTNQLGFLPELVTRPLVESKRLKLINVRSWKAIQVPVYLTVKNDMISQKLFKWMKGATREILGG